MPVDPVELHTLGFAEGGYLLLKRALREAGPGHSVTVTGTDPELEVDLRAWCRAEGHRFEWQTTAAEGGRAVIVSGSAEWDRWVGARRIGAEGVPDGDYVAERPPRTWGLAARGATIEAGAPEFDFHLVDKVRCGRTMPPGSTSRPSPHSGTRKRPSPGTRRSRSPTTSRTIRLGFADDEAAELSALHTRNFM
jgi:TusA-related sulfurtransferase